MQVPHPVANWSIAFARDREDFEANDYAHGLGMDAPWHMPAGSVKSTKCGYVYHSVCRRKD